MENKSNIITVAFFENNEQIISEINEFSKTNDRGRLHLDLTSEVDKAYFDLLMRFRLKLSISQML